MARWTQKLRQACAASVTGLLAALSSTLLAAEPAWPTRPVTIVVPFSAGGTTDVVARLVGQRLGEIWGQTVIVDNRAGAGGNIGAALVAKAAPDGHTLLMTSGSIFTVNPHLYRELPYDVQKDFVPVTNVASGPMVVVVPSASPARSVKELVAQARAKPGSINFGSAGVGSQVHMAGENFAYAAGIDLVHVPYRGEANAYGDLMAGQIQLVVGNIGAVAGLVGQGRIRALAVTGKERSSMMPEVPTVAESGLPGFENTGWFGLVAPAGTPRAVVDKIQRDTAKVLAQTEIKAKLTVQGMVPVGNTPAEFAKAIEAESRKWAEVVRNRKLTVQ